MKVITQSGYKDVWIKNFWGGKISSIDVQNFYLDSKQNKNLSPTCFKLVNQTLVAIGFDVFFKLLDTNRRNFELKCVILLSVNNEFSFRYKIIT